MAWTQPAHPIRLLLTPQGHPRVCCQNSGCRGLTGCRISKKACGLQGGGERGAGAAGCAWSACPAGAGDTDLGSL